MSSMRPAGFSANPTHPGPTPFPRLPLVGPFCCIPEIFIQPSSVIGRQAPNTPTFPPSIPCFRPPAPHEPARPGPPAPFPVSRGRTSGLLPVATTHRDQGSPPERLDGRPEVEPAAIDHERRDSGAIVFGCPVPRPLAPGWVPPATDAGPGDGGEDGVGGRR